MVGDPSGRSDLRQMLTPAIIAENVSRFREQMKILLDFTDDKAIMVNNADWLLDLNYITFLREVGVHFSVNRMLTAECFKQRLEHGLSFLEFNYMLMQAYDFLELSRQYDCRLQLGGDDQWSNILAGVDLVRRKDQKSVYGMTFKLLTTSTGQKMGKTSEGAVWLDSGRTPPFDFYQYWRNIDDADVVNCLKMLTFVSLEEIREYAGLQDAQINEAKKRLAFEVTAIVHGRQAAEEARRQAQDLFEGSGRSDNMPSTNIDQDRLAEGVLLLDLMLEAKIISSKGEGRRLIQQNGISLNDNQVADVFFTLHKEDFQNGDLILRKGKKLYHRLIME